MGEPQGPSPPRKLPLAGTLLLIEGALLVALAVWSGAHLSPGLAFPELVAVIIIAGAVLLGVAALGATVMVRGAMMIRRARRPVIVAGLSLQAPVVATLFFFSLLDAALWLFVAGAGLALLTGVSLMLALRVGPKPAS